MTALQCKHTQILKIDFCCYFQTGKDTYTHTEKRMNFHKITAACVYLVK